MWLAEMRRLLGASVDLAQQQSWINILCRYYILAVCSLSAVQKSEQLDHGKFACAPSGGPSAIAANRLRCSGSSRLACGRFRVLMPEVSGIFGVVGGEFVKSWVDPW